MITDPYAARKQAAHSRIFCDSPRRVASFPTLPDQSSSSARVCRACETNRSDLIKELPGMSQGKAVGISYWEEAADVVSELPQHSNTVQFFANRAAVECLNQE